MQKECLEEREAEIYRTLLTQSAQLSATLRTPNDQSLLRGIRGVTGFRLRESAPHTSHNSGNIPYKGQNLTTSPKLLDLVREIAIFTRFGDTELGPNGKETAANCLLK